MLGGSWHGESRPAFVLVHVPLLIEVSQTYILIVAETMAHTATHDDYKDKLHRLAEHIKVTLGCS